MPFKSIKNLLLRIAIAEGCITAIDEVACELDASQCNTKTAIELAKQIKKRIAQNIGSSILCSIGLAPNAFLAKIATNMQKPDGLVLIEPNDIPRKLYPVPFEDVSGLGVNMRHRLYKAGISNMEQLYQLSPKHMRAIGHSVEGERLYYKIRGIQLENKETKRRTVGHTGHFLQF